MTLGQTAPPCLSDILHQGHPSDPAECGCWCMEHLGTEQGAKPISSGERQVRKLTFMESFAEHQAGATSLDPTFITQNLMKPSHLYT